MTYTDYEDDGRVKSSLSTHYDSGWYTVETANTYDSGGTLTSVDTKSAPALDWTGTARASLKDYSTTAYTWSWWDSAQEASQVVTPDGGSTATPDSQTWTYDANGHVTSIAVSDPQGARTLTYVTDVSGQVMVRQDTTTVKSGGSGLADVLAGVVSLTATRPMEMYYYANGVRFGDVGNDSGPAAGYGYAGPQTTVFRGGSSPTQFADFDQSYDPVGPTSSGGQAAQASYLAQGGESLSALAQSTYGDSSLWWMIAEANGLSGDTTLAQGQRLTLPNATRSQNTSSTFRPYDPNEALGNIAFRSPNPPKEPKEACGGMGPVLMVLVAIAVTAIAGPYAVAGAINALGGTAAVSGSLLSGTLGVTVTAGSAAVVGAGYIAGGVAVGALSSAAGQGVGLATHTIDKFNWKQVGLSALTAGVSKGLSGSEVMGSIEAGLHETVLGAAVIDSVAANMIGQEIGIGLGWQDRFNWASVAVAGLTAGLDTRFPGMGLIGHALTGMAGAIVGAGTQTLIDGSDFGDNLLQALPGVIGATVGEWVAGEVAGSSFGAPAAPGQAALASQASPQDLADAGYPYAVATDPAGDLILQKDPDGNPILAPGGGGLISLSGTDPDIAFGGDTVGWQGTAVTGWNEDGSLILGGSGASTEFASDGSAGGILHSSWRSNPNNRSVVHQATPEGSGTTYLWVDKLDGSPTSIPGLGLSIYFDSGYSPAALPSNLPVMTAGPGLAQSYFNGIGQDWGRGWRDASGEARLAFANPANYSNPLLLGLSLGNLVTRPLGNALGGAARPFFPDSNDRWAIGAAAANNANHSFFLDPHHVFTPQEQRDFLGQAAIAAGTMKLPLGGLAADSAPGLIGSYTPSAGLKYGTTLFGDEAHAAAGTMLREQLEAQGVTGIIDRTGPGLRGVDLSVDPIYAKQLGFEHIEIKPNTASGLRTFNRQVERWGHNPSSVRAVTYDANGNVRWGFDF